MRIYGIVGEDGGGFFVKAPVDMTFDAFLQLVGTPGATFSLDGGCWSFVDSSEERAEWVEGGTYVDPDFLEAIAASNIDVIKEVEDVSLLLRAFEYEVPDWAEQIDWGSDYETDGPCARRLDEGHRAFTATCDLMHPFPVVGYEE